MFIIFYYIWFIDTENLCSILFLKEKMTRFWHLKLFISLTLKYAPHLTVLKINKRWGRLLEETQYLKFILDII